jgi:3-dehydroquinate synthetase
MSSTCPACGNKKRTFFTKSKKKDFSLGNYTYFKCLKCLSFYVDTKNLNEKINLILIKKIGQTTRPNGFAVNSGEIKKFLSC